MTRRLAVPTPDVDPQAGAAHRKQAGCGLLDLAFQRTAFQQAEGQTQMRVLAQQPPLKVVRGFRQPGGGQAVHLLNVSGGVLGGDALTVRAQVAAGAQAQLTTTGATRIYRQRSGLPGAVQRNEFSVGAGARLEVLPDALIPYADSRYEQQTQIALAEDAGLFYWEIVAPGRVARGESFAYDELRLALDICAEGVPIARERLRLCPAERAPASPLRLGPFLYFGVLYICRVGRPAAEWLALERQLQGQAETFASSAGETLWGVSTLPAHGLAVRGLGMTHRGLAAGLLRLLQTAKEALDGEQLTLPRKMY